MVSNSLEPREQTKAGSYSIDCSKSSTGLFCGIVVLVVTIISLIVFFVFISNEDLRLRKLAVQVAAFSELIIYSLTSVAVLVAMWQMRRLCYDQSHRLELDNQRLQRELEAARSERNKVEKEVVHEFESENRKITANMSKLEEQVTLSQSIVQFLFPHFTLSGSA